MNVVISPTRSRWEQSNHSRVEREVERRIAKTPGHDLALATQRDGMRLVREFARCTSDPGQSLRLPGRDGGSR